MTSLQPLVALLAQTERQRDLALADHLKAQTLRDAAQSQADQLVAYRREYEQRWSAQFCREGKIELVRCYQGFIHRLTQAVEQQQRVAAHAALQVERAEAIVRGHELRAASLKKLIERRLRQSEANDVRNEQKESDDRAVRASWNRLTAPGPARFL